MPRTNTSVEILGTAWSLAFRAQSEDPLLRERAGYTDQTTHEIVILAHLDDDQDDAVGDFDIYQQEVLRHEIIHAFLFESGLGDYALPPTEDGGHPEQMIDWFAIQYPKIQAVFKQLHCEGAYASKD